MQGGMFARFCSHQKLLFGCGFHRCDVKEFFVVSTFRLLNLFFLNPFFHSSIVVIDFGHQQEVCG